MMKVCQPHNKQSPWRLNHQRNSRIILKSSGWYEWSTEALIKRKRMDTNMNTEGLTLKSQYSVGLFYMLKS